jgi:hypothetical protein
MKKSVIIFASFVIIGFAIPTATDAVATKFTSCVVGGVTAPWLTTKLTSQVSKSTDTAKGAISSIICAKWPVLCSVGGVNTVPVADSGVKGAVKSDTSNTNAKELWWDTIARCGAREILSKVSGDIVSTARTSGRDGSTTYVKNWRYFLTSAEYRGEDMFRAILSNTNVCDYMAKEAKDAFGVNKKIDLPGVNTRSSDLNSYALRANCTMPKGFSISNYQKDFQGNGGWEAFSRLLDGANNPYGMMLMSMDEIAKQRAVEVTADTAQAAANGGQLGISGKTANDSCLIKGMTGSCLVYKDIKTPGSYINANLAATIQQELAWIGSVDEVGELIASLTEIILNRLTNLSNPDEGNAYIEEPLPDSPSPEEPAPVCLDRGVYADALLGAMNKVLDANPDLANSQNIDENNFAFLALVAANPPAGFNVTDQVLNGHDNPNTGDLLAIWKTGDAKMERYDVIKEHGDGGSPLSKFITTNFTGRIPLDCTNSGGGNGCTCESFGPIPTPPLPVPTCTAPEYEGNLWGAMADVLRENNALAEAKNTKTNDLAFLSLVAANPPDGFNITDQVFGKDDKPNPGNLLSIWRTGDIEMERYSVIENHGNAGQPLSKYIIADFEGQVPLSCTTSGNGQNCNCKPAEPVPGEACIDDYDLNFRGGLTRIRSEFIELPVFIETICSAPGICSGGNEGIAFIKWIGENTLILEKGRLAAKDVDSANPAIPLLEKVEWDIEKHQNLVLDDYYDGYDATKAQNSQQSIMTQLTALVALPQCRQ